MKFIHIADVHWGAKPEKDRAWRIDRGEEIKEAFRRVITYVKEQQTDLLLISGDFFHKPPSYQEVKEVDYLFSKLPGTRIVWIAGNHDHLKEGSVLEKFPFQSNVIFLKSSEIEKVSFQELNTVVYGLSYWKDMIKEPLYDGVKPTEEDGIRILLAHGGDETHIPINRETLKWSGFDYIALGHIHKPEIIYEDLMAYAGSLEPLDRTETGLHGLIEGEITDEKQVISFLPFSKRKYLDTEVYITEEMIGEEILDRIKNEIICYGEENIHRILLYGTKNPVVQPNFERLMDQYYISKVEDRTEGLWDYEQLSKEDDLLIKNVAEILKDQPKALSYAMEALSAARENEL